MIIEIIPNWHPLLVHFTIGLLSTSVLFYLAAAFLSKENSWKQQWLNMANWSLWSGCLFAIGTAIAGWFAYNSVAHDEPAHVAMTLHRNWALPTAATFLLLGVWAIILARKNRHPGFMFLSFSVIAAGLLMVTGWLGAEAVYRYGLGVKSLPNSEGHHHHHHHGDKESSTEEESNGHNHNHEKSSTGGEESDGHNHSHEEFSTEGEESDGHNHSHNESTIEEKETATHNHSHEESSIKGDESDRHSHNHEDLSVK